MEWSPGGGRVKRYKKLDLREAMDGYCKPLILDHVGVANEERRSRIEDRTLASEVRRGDQGWKRMRYTSIT